MNNEKQPEPNVIVWGPFKFVLRGCFALPLLLSLFLIIYFVVGVFSQIAANIFIVFVLGVWIYSEIAYKKQKVDFQSKKTEEISAGKSLARLTPFEFEKAVAEILKAHGYACSVTRKTGDRGVDILAQREGKTFVVQVKKFSKGNLVGRPALQELQGAMLDKTADGMMFVTLSYFSSEATRYARENGIRLMDRDELLEMAKRVPIEEILSKAKGEEGMI
ncbi:MAG: restriction endonuclease [Candidatus Omnitrophota bacterium]|nr:MAG: restriction endonuclease [Candidatus Omnitrophota bacterium]